MRLSIDDWTSICQAMPALIPPIKTVFNGEPLLPRTPIHRFRGVLPTINVDPQGHVKRTTRETELRVYEPLPGETGTLYEMGLPVVATGDKWHVEVMQKVPVNLERDNVSPVYLQTVRVAVLNEMSALLTQEDASSTWVRHAAGDDRIAGAAFNSIMDLRFGEKRVTYDPSDAEANLIATSQGFAVIGSASLSRDEWNNVRRFGSSLPAGRVTPSPKPFSRDGAPLKLLAPGSKTAQHRQFEAFATSLAKELINRSLNVTFAADLDWGFRGCYGKSHLIVNVSAMGSSWFTGTPPQLLENWIPFLIHEFAHDSVQGHLSDAYHQECCRLAGKVASFLFTKGSLTSLTS